LRCVPDRVSQSCRIDRGREEAKRPKVEVLTIALYSVVETAGAGFGEQNYVLGGVEEGGKHAPEKDDGQLHTTLGSPVQHPRTV
jgi:hypothetical protein